MYYIVVVKLYTLKEAVILKCVVNLYGISVSQMTKDMFPFVVIVCHNPVLSSFIAYFQST